MISKQHTIFLHWKNFPISEKSLAKNLLRLPRDTLPAQREYHVTVTRPKHRVPRPPPEASLTYIPGLLVRATEFEPSRVVVGLICVRAPSYPPPVF